MTYALCGLKVVSDLSLPELLPWAGDEREADVEIRLGDVPRQLDAPVHEGPLLQVGGDGSCRYVIPGVAEFYLQGGRRITLRPLMAPDAADIRLFLLGSVFGFLCHQRGLLPLHAGCVEIDGKAVAFAGPSGVGKSTLTAAFLRQGFRVLADDITVVDVAAPGGPTVLPSFPRIKLWHDVMGGLGLSPDGLERIRPQLQKFQLPLVEGFRKEPLPLATVYNLKTVSDPRHVGLAPLRGSAAVTALLEGVYRRMAAFHMNRRGSVMAAVAGAAGVPVLQLSRLADLRALGDTAAMIAARHIVDGGG